MRTFVLALTFSLLTWVLVVGLLLLAGRAQVAREIAAWLPNLARLFAGLARDPQVPRRCKALLALGLLWFASPIDLIPEFIPVVGPLDDALVGALILRYVLRRAGKEAVAEHWQGERATLDRMLRVAGMGFS